MTKTNTKTTANNLPAIYISKTDKLPDNAQWQNRFEVHSESSNRVYVVAQNIDKRHFGCSCPGWKSHRKCKHLAALGLPAYEKPYEVNVVAR